MKTRAGFAVITGETFPYDVLVCLGVTAEQIFKYYDKKFVNCFTKREKESISESTSKGYTLRLKNNALIMWVKEFPKSPEQFGWLAHEIFHTADLMLRRAGVTLSDDSDEVWAYQIDWLTKRIYEEFHLVNSTQLKKRKK